MSLRAAPVFVLLVVAVTGHAAYAEARPPEPHYTFLAESLLSCAAAFHKLSQCPYTADSPQVPQTYAAQSVGFFGAAAQVMATVSASYGRFIAMARRQQSRVQARVVGERCEQTEFRYYFPCMAFVADPVGSFQALLATPSAPSAGRR